MLNTIVVLPNRFLAAQTRKLLIRNNMNNLINTKIMKKILTIFITLTFPILLIAQEGKTKLTANELLQMQESEAFNAISKLSKEDSAEIITQIRSSARKEYQNIDKFYLVISHLESIKAIEEEQARLRSLNLVYGLALLLVLGLLGYILYSQRKTIQNLNQLLK